MYRVAMISLLGLSVAAIGCETGTLRENVSTTGWTGQKVGQTSNNLSGPVPGSTTGTPGDMQNPQPKPAQAFPVAKQNLDSD